MTTPTNSDRLPAPWLITLEAEINKLQEERAETIEVLEGFPGWDQGSVPDRWWARQGKPLLDKLKGESCRIGKKEDRKWTTAGTNSSG